MCGNKNFIEQMTIKTDDNDQRAQNTIGYRALINYLF